jgi:hypothetical protein
MSSALTIRVPADVAAQLRGALYADLARAGCDLDASCSTKEPGDYASPVGKLRRLFAVLDDIGWTKEPPSPEALTIHRRHMQVVVDTLGDDRDGWAWVAGQPQLEDLPGRERAKATAEMIERFLATLPASAATLTIPPSLVPQVREGAVELAKDVAEAIDQGDDPRGCAERLTAVARLLDATDDKNTGAIVELDIAEHGETLRRALVVMLPLLENWINEVKADDPSKPERENELRLMRQLVAQVTHATGGGE